MGLIVALTGAAGWLCSFLLLHAGFGSMVVRYPLALCGAYVFFLFLLWLWLRTRAEDYVDLPDPVQGVDLFSGSPGAPAPSISSGGGGDFAGGGASGSFDDVGVGPISEPGVLSSIGDAAGSGLDADELAIPIIAVVLAIGLALASLYVVYLAPALFAELLFDGVLSYTLYRRLRHADSDHWLGTAFRRTVVPFALTAVFLMAVGAAMSVYAPGAHSMGEALHQNSAAR
ncbi:hypothetical protein RS694_14840 [Rhodoferax saidenbachensis]|uniref:Uncharacterized protein n=2 Tax=Rhodoferax saidenbachensis TaxID=1484693 RepID=A0A1P8KFY4_9BURK|nr:hypothetical protein RS694_14840 [Rhodoferax saidenbachensis]